MAVPTTRQEFKDYCLRRLGAPVTQINLSDDQIDDRIDEALLFYYDYHYDGSQLVYYKYQVTQQDKDNKYITLPQDTIGAVRIFSIQDNLSLGGFFNITYQIALNDLYSLTSQSLVPYYMTFSHVQQIKDLLVGHQPVRFNRHVNKFYIDMNWDRVNVGQYLIIELYQKVDPEVYPDAWGDRWLQRYATCLMKEQWGINLTKFTGLQLAGGVQFNGDRILTDAQNEKKDLEEQVISHFSLPNYDMIG